MRPDLGSLGIKKLTIGSIEIPTHLLDIQIDGGEIRVMVLDDQIAQLFEAQKPEPEVAQGGLKRFFLVWEPRSGYTKFRHDSFKSAKTEASRLAKYAKGAEFMILTPLLTVQDGEHEVETKWGKAFFSGLLTKLFPLPVKLKDTPDDFEDDIPF